MAGAKKESAKLEQLREKNVQLELAHRYIAFYLFAFECDVDVQSSSYTLLTPHLHNITHAVSKNRMLAQEDSVLFAKSVHALDAISAATSFSLQEQKFNDHEHKSNLHKSEVSKLRNELALVHKQIESQRSSQPTNQIPHSKEKGDRL